MRFRRAGVSDCGEGAYPESKNLCERVKGRVEGSCALSRYFNYHKQQQPASLSKSDGHLNYLIT